MSEDERAAEAVKETIRAENAAMTTDTHGGRGGGLWQWIPGLSWYGYGSKTGTTPPGQSPEGPGPPNPSQEGAPLALEAPPSSDDTSGYKGDSELGQICYNSNIRYIDLDLSKYIIIYLSRFYPLPVHYNITVKHIVMS